MNFGVGMIRAPEFIRVSFNQMIGRLHNSSTSREFVCLSKIYGDRCAFGLIKHVFNIVWILIYLEIFRLLIQSLMKLVFSINNTQNDFYVGFFQNPCRKNPKLTMCYSKLLSFILNQIIIHEINSNQYFRT